MKNESLRFACVGTSAIMRVMLEAMRETPGVTASVIFSRDAERGRAFAASEAIGASCDDFDAMLARPDVDAVYIASPNSCHAEQAIHAIERGKHVIVEKPTATTARELKAMLTAARANHVFFFEAITTLFMPNYVFCKRLLSQLGDVRSARICYGQYSSKYDAYLRGENPNIFSPALQGGALNDMGVYCVHMAVDLFGPPRSVSYEAKRGVNGVDLSGILSLAYPGFLCEIETAKDHDVGSGCRVEADGGWFAESGPINAFAACEALQNGAPVPVPPQPDRNRMLYELCRFRDAIAERDDDFFRAMALQSLLVAEVLEQARVGDGLTL